MNRKAGEIKEESMGIKIIFNDVISLEAPAPTSVLTC